ncbi:MAG: hypothetical protein IT428_26270 [Planctomycetaceae bacterium]|nr:hypothetical protein [Planctomycetaceae bacterium]
MLTLVFCAVLTADPATPNEVIERAVIDVATIEPPEDRKHFRYLSLWPSSRSRQPSLEHALSFWLNSLTWAPSAIPLEPVQNGVLYRLDLRRLGWSAAAWERLAAIDPYFAVPTHVDGKIRRGWLDPKVEAVLRQETGSTRAVLRADWFLARTSLDGEKGFFRQGFYSEFLALPKTVAELETILNAKEELKLPATNGLDTIFNVQGDATKDSGVAQHNRGAELLPTLVGKGRRFEWRTLDTDSNAGKSSAQRQLAGKLTKAGSELIFSLPNGLHGYYAANAEGKRVGEVPGNIAQDKTHPHDFIVYTSWKCVRCHGPQDGINGIDGMIRRQMVAKNTALALIKKEHAPKDERLQARIDAYYRSPLRPEIEGQREDYARVLREEINGLTGAENTRHYLSWIEGYLYGRVDLATVRQETGFGESTPALIKLTSPSDLTPLPDGEWVSREAFEDNFARLMTATIHPWEKH